MVLRYVTYLKQGDNVGLVTGIHQSNASLQLDGAIEINYADPEKLDYPNFKALMMIKLDTKELYYDYISIENTETRLAQTQKELTDVQQALADTYEQLALTQLENTNTQAAMSDLYEQLILVQAELLTLKGGE